MNDMHWLECAMCPKEVMQGIAIIVQPLDKAIKVSGIP
jgi:hypothetical protein